MLHCKWCQTFKLAYHDSLCCIYKQAGACHKLQEILTYGLCLQSLKPIFIIKLAIITMKRSTPEHFSNPRKEIQNLFCSWQKNMARPCVQHVLFIIIIHNRKQFHVKEEPRANSVHVLIKMSYLLFINMLHFQYELIFNFDKE